MSTEIFCTKCGLTINPDWKYCLRCGEQVRDIKYCVECGKKLDSDWGYCPWCGKEISEINVAELDSPKKLSSPVKRTPQCNLVSDASLYDEDIPF